jgi:2-octaprenyl-6-methoxyphenol hydroxylase
MIHEFFNIERKMKSNFLIKSLKQISKYPRINKMFTEIADRGILF